MESPFRNAYEAFKSLVKDLNQSARNQLKLLLETKHLYQKVTIDADRIINEVQERLNETSGQQRQEFKNGLSETLNARFFPTDVELHPEEPLNPPFLQLLMPNVKVFCDKCDSREAFSPVWFIDVTTPLLQPAGYRAHFEQGLPNTFQLFVLVYQCQRCRGVPIAFQVRRDKWNLILEGRSPIEHIELPSFIPKTESGFFRDALIAKNTGKVLAAIFYLRLFLEQFARRQTGRTDKATGEEIMNAYGASLPPQIRDAMPSLREWYEKLSKAIHEAREDAELFEEARGEIERHFDMRRVHRIPDIS